MATTNRVFVSPFGNSYDVRTVDHVPDAVYIESQKHGEDLCAIIKRNDQNLLYVDEGEKFSDIFLLGLDAFSQAKMIPQLRKKP